VAHSFDRGAVALCILLCGERGRNEGGRLGLGDAFHGGKREPGPFEEPISEAEVPLLERGCLRLSQRRSRVGDGIERLYRRRKFFEFFWVLPSKVLSARGPVRNGGPYGEVADLGARQPACAGMVRSGGPYGMLRLRSRAMGFA
jgi:hypothetical protein